jgi:stress response protein SCP2
MHDQYYLFDIQLEIINDFGVIKKERNAYGEIVQMQAREVVWKYRIAGNFTVPNIVLLGTLRFAQQDYYEIPFDL